MGKIKDKNQEKNQDKNQMPDLIKLREKVQKALEVKRYEHTLGVAYTAAAMAMVHAPELITKAQIAGLLHDCAKNLTNEKRTQICKKNHIEISVSEKKNPVLLHAKVGSFLAKTEYGIEDTQILDAITYHTTGCPAMTTLDKIIYIADYIEPGRCKAPNLEEVRRLAFENLDVCLLKILQDTLDYLKESSGEIDTLTIQTYEYYAYKQEKGE